MHPKRKLLLTTLSICVCLTLAFAPAAGVVESRTLAEIQAEIEAQNAELAALQAQIDAAQGNVTNLESQIGSAQGTIPQLQAQIEQIEASIALNNLQLQKLTQQQAIMELEAERRAKQQDRALKHAYLNWRADSKMGGYLLEENQTNPLKYDIYQSAVMDIEKLSIDELQAQIGELKSTVEDMKNSTATLEQQNADLKTRKQQLEAQILALQYSLNGANGQVAGLKAQSNVVQSRIAQLSSEQKALQDYEAFILGQSGNGGNAQLQSGQIYFTGQGRELYQGHGVGMSQYGAYGAAKAGWTAAQIVTFYYTGTQVGTTSATINVEGYGQMDLNTYAAGQGEVPAKACGTAEQVASDPYKYVLDNGNFWACWPEEAIKAQVIAYRSYGLYQALNYGGSICTDARCQVYNGGNASNWAAVETQNQVIVYGGNVIEALYSSDNNNGWGTANNDTRFSDIAGNGNPVPYLRAVNDSAFAAHSSWTTWGWRTNGYTMSHITQLIQFAANDGYLTSGARSYMTSVRDTVGNVANLSFVRDPSGRVAKVVVTGTNGASVNLAGWFFKTIWNSWIDQVSPTGQSDFIYSQTFFLLTY